MPNEGNYRDIRKKVVQIRHIPVEKLGIRIGWIAEYLDDDGYWQRNASASPSSLAAGQAALTAYRKTQLDGK